MEGPAHSAIQPRNAPFGRTMENIDQFNNPQIKDATRRGLILINYLKNLRSESEINFGWNADDMCVKKYPQVKYFF
jgi:hypothetical protein